ncbi:MAG: tryptophan-rich sensory protein [Salinispira sp.]
MKKHTALYTILNVAGFIATLLINALANILPFNGRTTGEISDSYPNLFVPANITFSIWSVIYTLLAAFIVYSIFASARKKPDRSRDFIATIGPWFFVSSIFNVLWIIAWHAEIIPLTLLLMLFFFAALLRIYVLLGIGAAGGTGSAGVVGAGGTRTIRRICVELPFSVYVGWVTVATIANVTAFLVSVNWNGFGIAESFWTVLVIVTAVLITGFMIIRKRDYGYTLVVMWALFGIWLKRSSVESPTSSVAVFSMLGVIILAAMLVLRILMSRRAMKA